MQGFQRRPGHCTGPAGDLSWADISAMAVVCAEADPKAMEDAGGKSGSGECCLGSPHAGLMIVLHFSTAVLRARVFPKPEDCYTVSRA